MQSRRRTSPSGVVAFLLTDVEGSTRLWQEHRAVMPATIARHDELLRSNIEANRGRVLTERGEGDSFFAIFQRASDAIAAARDIQRALNAEAWPDGITIRVRMAINTGEAGGDYRGMAANRSARIRQLARGGQVLISQTTHGLVADAGVQGITYRELGTQHLKDVDRPEHLFEVLVDGVSVVGSEPAGVSSRRRRLLIAATLAVALAAAASSGYALHSRAGGAAPRPGPAAHASALATRKLVITTVAGQGGPAGYAPGLTRATDAKLDQPQGLAIDRTGDVFVADTGNNLVRELLPDGTLQDVVGGGGEVAAVGEQGVDVKLDHPTGLFFDSGQLYIADTGSHRVVRFDVQTGHVFLVAGNGRAGTVGLSGLAVDAELESPTGVAHGLLSSQPNVYGVAETGVVVVDTAAARVRQVEDFDGSLNPFLNIHAGGLPSVAVSSSGIFYVGDSAGAVVYRWNPANFEPGSGGLPVIAGTGTPGDSGDGGPAVAAQLNQPEGLAVDAGGDVYICDTGNSVVRVVNANTGKISTFAGVAGVASFGGDGGPPAQAALASPAAVAVAPDGSVYIADTGNNRIRRITAVP